MKMWWGDSDFGFSDKMCLFLKHWLCVLTDGKENSRRLEIIVFLVFTVCLSLFALLSYLHRSSEVKAKEPPKTWVLFRMQFLGWSNFVSGKSELSRLLIQMITGNLAIPTSDLFRSAPIEAKKSFELSLSWLQYSVYNGNNNDKGGSLFIGVCECVLQGRAFRVYECARQWLLGSVVLNPIHLMSYWVEFERDVVWPSMYVNVTKASQKYLKYTIIWM